jgi:hypothetical protein
MRSLVGLVVAAACSTTPAPGGLDSARFGDSLDAAATSLAVACDPPHALGASPFAARTCRGVRAPFQAFGRVARLVLVGEGTRLVGTHVFFPGCTDFTALWGQIAGRYGFELTSHAGKLVTSRGWAEGSLALWRAGDVCELAIGSGGYIVNNPFEAIASLVGADHRVRDPGP